MKIAIISDIHDNFPNLILALRKIKELKADKILFLGDFMNNGVARLLSAAPIPVFGVWGNNDGDKVAITMTSLKEGSMLKMSENVYESLEIEGRKIFITHYDDLAPLVARSGDFDAVFYGHNHIKTITKLGKCIVINPGEISAHKTGKATMAIYDTKTNEGEIIEIAGSITLKTKDFKDYLQEVKNIA
jgi:hypothetical protein